MNKLTKILSSLLFVILFTSCDLKIVDYHTSFSVTPETVQRKKRNYLGAKVTIEMIGNDAKLTIFPNEGNNEIFILSKIADGNSNNNYQDIYEYQLNKREKLVLRVNTLLSFITSAKLENMENYSTMGYISIERSF